MTASHLRPMRITRCALACVCVAQLAACPDRTKESNKQTPSTTLPSNAPPPTDAADSTAPPPTRLKKHMQRHFEAIRHIERAIAHGDLPRAKQHALWLANHAAHHDLETNDDQLQRVRVIAKQIAELNALDTAPALAAKLGAACGACHMALSKITTFPWVPLPEDSQALRDRMRRHLWGIDRLWEGLVGPSGTLWVEGANVLAAEPLPIDAITRDPVKRAQVAKLIAQLHQLGKKAQKATDELTRTNVYAALLGTCASCHKLARNSRGAPKSAR